MTKGKFVQEIEGYPVYDSERLKKCLPGMRELADRREAAEVVCVWGSDLARANFQAPRELRQFKPRVKGRLVEVEEENGGEKIRIIGYEVWLPTKRKLVVVPEEKMG